MLKHACHKRAWAGRFLHTNRHVCTCSTPCLCEVTCVARAHTGTGTPTCGVTLVTHLRTLARVQGHKYTCVHFVTRMYGLTCVHGQKYSHLCVVTPVGTHTYTLACARRHQYPHVRVVPPAYLCVHPGVCSRARVHPCVCCQHLLLHVCTP